MSLLNFYASKLYRQKKGESYTDDDGNYHPGKNEWEYCCECDVVPAGASNKVAIPDGSVDYYTYDVYNIPVGIKSFEYGEFIKLELLGGKEEILKVKGFHRYQYQCKIWA